jgi:hypothetical protein
VALDSFLIRDQDAVLGAEGVVTVVFLVPESWCFSLVILRLLMFEKSKIDTQKYREGTELYYQIRSPFSSTLA